MGNSSGFEKGVLELRDAGRTKNVNFITKSKMALLFDVKDERTDELYYKIDMNDNFSRETIKIYEPSGELSLCAFGDRNWGFDESTKVYAIGKPSYLDQKSEDKDVCEKFSKQMKAPEIIEKGLYRWGAIEGRVVTQIQAKLRLNKGDAEVIDGYNSIKSAGTRALRISTANGELCGYSVATPGTNRTIQLEYHEKSDLLQMVLLVAFTKQMARKQGKKRSIRAARNNG